MRIDGESFKRVDDNGLAECEQWYQTVLACVNICSSGSGAAETAYECQEGGPTGTAFKS